MISYLGGMFIGWSLGANDSANVFGTTVSSNMVRFRTAVIQHPKTTPLSEIYPRPIPKTASKNIQSLQNTRYPNIWVTHFCDISGIQGYIFIIDIHWEEAKLRSALWV